MLQCAIPEDSIRPFRADQPINVHVSTYQADTIEINNLTFQVCEQEKETQPWLGKDLVRLALRILVIGAIIVTGIGTIRDFKDKDEDDSITILTGNEIGSSNTSLYLSENIINSTDISDSKDDSSNVTWKLIVLISAFIIFAVDLGTEIKDSQLNCCKPKNAVAPNKVKIIVKEALENNSIGSERVDPRISDIFSRTTSEPIDITTIRPPKTLPKPVLIRSNKKPKWNNYF